MGKHLIQFFYYFHQKSLFLSQEAFSFFKMCYNFFIKLNLFRLPSFDPKEGFFLVFFSLFACVAPLVHSRIHSVDILPLRLSAYAPSRTFTAVNSNSVLAVLGYKEGPLIPRSLLKSKLGISRSCAFCISLLFIALSHSPSGRKPATSRNAVITFSFLFF